LSGIDGFPFLLHCNIRYHISIFKARVSNLKILIIQDIIAFIESIKQKNPDYYFLLQCNKKLLDSDYFCRKLSPGKTTTGRSSKTGLNGLINILPMIRPLNETCILFKKRSMIMNNTYMIKELVIDTGKAAHEVSFKGLDLLHDNIEKATGEALARLPWLTDDHRNTVRDWFKNARKGRNTLKSTIDENFKTVEGWFSAS